MPASKKSARALNATSSIAVCKTASCPTLSGSSNLEYQLGKDSADKLYFRISGSDGNGFFSQEWVPWADIQKALTAADPITSVVLRSLLTGQSVNTTGFLLAALLKEKIVERMPGKTKHLRLLDTAAFLDKVCKLPPGKPAEATNATPKKAAITPAKKSPAKSSATKPKAKFAAAK